MAGSDQFGDAFRGQANAVLVILVSLGDPINMLVS
jgi:hypothetical protein